MNESVDAINSAKKLELQEQTKTKHRSGSLVFLFMSSGFNINNASKLHTFVRSISLRISEHKQSFVLDQKYSQTIL